MGSWIKIKIKIVRGGDFDDDMGVYSNIIVSSGIISTTKRRKVSRKKMDFFRVFAICLLIVMVMAYLFVVSREAVIGHQIRHYEKEIDHSRSLNNDLRIKVSKLRSIDTLEDKATEFGMVKFSDTGYIGAVDNLAMNVDR